jgi:hypothetical protein
MAVTRMRRSSKEVVEYPVVANTPAPLGWPQAFDIPAERISLKGVEGCFNAKLIFAGKVF